MACRLPALSVVLVLVLALAACVPPPASPPLAIEVAPALAVAAPEPAARAAELAGLSAAEVSARLGPAELRRRDQGAEIWLYGAGNCNLWLYLYDQPGAPALRVLHYEFMAGEDASVDEAACYGALLAKAAEG